MNNTGKAIVILYTIPIAIVIAILYGWVMNIIALCGIEEFVLTGKNVLRVVGIFVPPLGGLMGYL
jgi:hypothetical protein